MTSSILGSTSPSEFIERYWQKEPLSIPGAFPGEMCSIDGNDLAGLACEPGIDSRIILHDEASDEWTCEHGPFAESRFPSLPERGWSLLVQSVDQWLPEVAAVLDHFGFLPRWRLDDVMISYAVDGGNVGPHFDFYDVFLMQTSGRREWQLGQRCDENSPLRDHPDLKLLREFDVSDNHTLEAGDMLYLPPGVAHWGRAVGDDCITFSIGFRAPANRDIVCHAVENMTGGPGAGGLYRDTPAAIDQDRWCINEMVAGNLRPAWERVASGDISGHLNSALGEQVTEPKYPAEILPPEGFDEADAEAVISQQKEVAVTHHACSRFAYRKLPGSKSAELFVDGLTFRTTRDLARGVCHGKISGDALATSDERVLLLMLLCRGSLSLSAASEQS